MSYTKYQKAWEKDRPWLAPVKTDIYQSYCKVCQTSITTKQNGTDKLKQHERTSKHKDALQSRSSQSSLVSCNETLKMSKSTLEERLDLNQEVIAAEVYQALHVVATNQSFSSTNSDSKRFKKMFPRCEIAELYSQHANKTKYVIVYGIAPYVKKLLMEDVKDTFFCYKFDETTTSQVKKQYDGYVTYFSKEHKQVVTRYSGSLFLGHCSSQDLVSHFYEFLDSLKLTPVWLMNLGMDGPSVNQSFQKKLKLDLEKKSQDFIDIGSCPLHIANNGFKKALDEIKSIIDLNEIATDLHFFFKRSAARREDYKLAEEITETTVWFMKKHVESRWLSIDRSLVRILEQLPNLRVYFLEKLPKEKGFHAKNGLASNSRYKRICKILNSKEAEVCMSFIIFLSRDFSRFMVPLQSSAPMVHRLYPMCYDLIRSILAKVVKDTMLNPYGKRLANSKLSEMDLTKDENLKVT